MFEVFGNFDSVEEINKAAEGLKNEGDTKNLYVLAEENGIDRDFVDMYIAGDLIRFCDVATAAIGKIDVEAKEVNPKEIVADWVEYIKVQCLENEQLSRAVRSKKKTLKGCIAELLKWSFKNSYAVDKDIVKAAGVNASVKMGIPGMGNAKKMIREYYLGK